MPFRGTLRARLLELLGSGGLRIIGATDPPRFEFYSGLDSEVSPGLIRIEPIPGGNDVAMLLLAAPELDAVTGPASLLLISREDGSRDARFNLETLLLDNVGESIIGTVANRLRIQNQGTASEIDFQDDGDIAYQAPGGAVHRMFGGTRIEDGGLQFRDSGADVADIVFGLAQGSGTDTTSGGIGNVQIPHNFGDTNFRAVGQPNSAGGARFATRTPSNDTNTTIGFRIWNDAGGNPANGTSITVEWIGHKFAS